MLRLGREIGVPSDASRSTRAPSLYQIQPQPGDRISLLVSSLHRTHLANVAFSGALQRVRCKAGLDGFSYWLSRPTDFRCCCRACSKRNAVGRTSGR